jgi:putative transposase
LKVSTFAKVRLDLYLPTIVTDKTFDHYEADFLRFMSTTECVFDAPEHVDLFDGIIDPSRPDSTADSPPTLKLPAPASRSAMVTSAEDNDDLIE